MSISPKILALFLFCITAKPCFSEQEFSLIRSEGNFPPYEMVDDEGELVGFHVELVNAVSKKIERKPHYIPLPWRRALHDLNHGKADAMISVVYTPERETLAWFLPDNSLGNVFHSFCVLKTHSLAQNYSGQLKQLSPFRIALVKGYQYTEPVEQASYLQKYYIAKDEVHQLKLLMGGRVEVILLDRRVIGYLTKKQGLSDRVVCLDPSFKVGLEYIIFSKLGQQQALAKEFAKALGQFKTTDEYQQLMDKYQIGEDPVFYQEQ